MTEEKKEEKQASAAPAPQAAPEVKPAEAPKAEASNPAQPEPAKPASVAPAAVAPKTEEKAKVKKEKPSNCATCNKSIKKKQMYYRNGKHYCSKRCWKATLKKEEPKETQEAPK